MAGVADDERADQQQPAHDDRVVDEALDWFARLRNAAPDRETQADFDAWLARSPRHAEEFRAIEAIWGSAAFGKAVAGLGTPTRPTRTVAAPRRRPRWTGGLTAAAVLLVALGLWQYPAIMLRWQADYLTAVGQQFTVTLPDGSTMMLDTTSAAAIDFEDGRRNVRLLDGQAFFDVQSDPARPFRVTGRFGAVEVTGTAFSVRSDAGQDRAVLERGRVEVSRLSGGTERVALEPGQMAVATAAALSTAMPVDATEALAWREGRVIFDDQPLARVLDELRRYHGGPVIVANAELGRVHVTGNYRLDDIEGAIRTLADAAGASMTRLPGGIIILR
jgi:transmembrane sensor